MDDYDADWNDTPREDPPCQLCKAFSEVFVKMATDVQEGGHAADRLEDNSGRNYDLTPLAYFASHPAFTDEEHLDWFCHRRCDFAKQMTIGEQPSGRRRLLIPTKAATDPTTVELTSAGTQSDDYGFTRFPTGLLTGWRRTDPDVNGIEAEVINMSSHAYIPGSNEAYTPSLNLHHDLHHVIEGQQG